MQMGTCSAGGLYDTKYLLRQLRPEGRSEDKAFPETSLGSAYARLQERNFAAAVKASFGVAWSGARTSLAPGSERYAGQAFAHEAG